MYTVCCTVQCVYRIYHVTVPYPAKRTSLLVISPCPCGDTLRIWEYDCAILAHPPPVSVSVPSTLLICCSRSFVLPSQKLLHTWSWFIKVDLATQDGRTCWRSLSTASVPEMLRIAAHNHNRLAGRFATIDFLALINKPAGEGIREMIKPKLKTNTQEHRLFCIYALM